MIRIIAYEPLCYHCLYGLGKNKFCTLDRDCDECHISDRYGTCFCVKEKPDVEVTCPHFKYRYLRG